MKVDMEDIRYTLFSEAPLVGEVTIKSIRPCVVAENMVRVLMQFDKEIGQVIPSLVTKYPPGKVNYLEKKNVLTLSIHQRLVTLYPSGKVSMNKTVDKEEAIHVIKDVAGVINETYLEIQGGTSASHDKIREKLSKLGPLAIYDCLPKTNCQLCGEVTCMAFALKLLSGDVELPLCTELFEPWNTSKVQCLEEVLGLEMMQSMGWKP
ncbi:(Fe-S)-binding protein [Methanobacterium aggregans]|uniref:(Fe-S)-binding protein n=1 Tax=Methanobacterium aggregans TaxID=1615586 RepID=UPI003211049D